MKTTKKGFTLIELIVVIAIIGVLAAILVPAMLGYVKKSKIQSANAAAKTVLNACNTALTEMDEVDDPALASITDDSQYGVEGAVDACNATLLSYMKYYCDNLKKDTFKWGVHIRGGVCVAAAAKSGKYYGSCPAYLTNTNYPSSGLSIATVLDAAKNKALAS